MVFHEQLYQLFTFSSKQCKWLHPLMTIFRASLDNSLYRPTDRQTHRVLAIDVPHIIRGSRPTSDKHNNAERSHYDTEYCCETVMWMARVLCEPSQRRSALEHTVNNAEIQFIIFCSWNFQDYRSSAVRLCHAVNTANTMCNRFNQFCLGWDTGSTDTAEAQRRSKLWKG